MFLAEILVSHIKMQGIKPKSFQITGPMLERIRHHYLFCPNFRLLKLYSKHIVEAYTTERLNII